MADPVQNPSILALYQSLCAQQDLLSNQLGNCTDAGLAGTLSNENFEIMHRIVLAQNLLFQSDSAALQASVAQVSTAANDLKTAIGKIQKAADVVTAVSTYLTYVDQAIDLAKTMMK